MSSRSTALADAVAAALNAAPDGTFAQRFTAVRVLNILLEEKKLGSAVNVHVAPRAFSSEPKARGVVRYRTMAVDVAVRKKCQTYSAGQVSNEELDGLVELVEQLSEFFRAGEDVGETGASWLKSETTDPIYDDLALHQRGLFIGYVTLTFEQV